MKGYRKYEEYGDIVFEREGLRFIIKTHYMPPYLLIEKYKPRSRVWNGIIQIDLDREDLVEMFKDISNEMEKALKEWLKTKEE